MFVLVNSFEGGGARKRELYARPAFALRFRSNQTTSGYLVGRKLSFSSLLLRHRVSDLLFLTERVKRFGRYSLDGIVSPIDRARIELARGGALRTRKVRSTIVDFRQLIIFQFKCHEGGLTPNGDRISATIVLAQSCRVVKKNITPLLRPSYMRYSQFVVKFDCRNGNYS